MNKFSRFILISVFSLAAIFLAACNAALPAGAEASVSQDGQSAQVEFTGVVDSISADQWVVSGQTLLVNAQTIIDGVFAAGDSVKVNATITSDGAVTANKLESPSADDSVSSADDSQPLPGTFDDSGNEYYGLVETISADSWSVSGQTFAVNAQTEFKNNILVGDSVKVHFVVNSDGTYTATEIELAVDQAQDDFAEQLKRPGNNRQSGSLYPRSMDCQRPGIQDRRADRDQG